MSASMVFPVGGCFFWRTRGEFFLFPPFFNEKDWKQTKFFPDSEKHRTAFTPLFASQLPVLFVRADIDWHYAFPGALKHIASTELIQKLLQIWGSQLPKSRPCHACPTSPVQGCDLCGPAHATHMQHTCNTHATHMQHDMQHDMQHEPFPWKFPGKVPAGMKIYIFHSKTGAECCTLNYVYGGLQKKQPFLFIVFGTSKHNIEVGGYGGNVCIYGVSCGWLFFLKNPVCYRYQALQTYIYIYIFNLYTHR